MAGIDFKVEGVAYNISYPMSTLKRYARENDGLSIPATISRIPSDTGDLNIDDLSAVFEAGLWKNHGGMTDAEVEAMMDEMTVTKIASLVGDAARDAFGDEEPDSGNASAGKKRSK